MKLKRAVLVGLDGVPLEIIENFTGRGIMPHTGEIMEQGVITRMQSSIPEVSSVAWSSIITGQNTGEHGIFGFTDLLPNSYKLKFPNFRDLKSKPFWDS